MLNSVFSIADKCYYKSNKKIYTRNNFCFTISNIVSEFNAVEFARWMSEGFRQSSFKNYRELAEAAKSNPATISRLINASPQTNTDKPSRPKSALVERLAVLFAKDVAYALKLAGYASKTDSSDLVEVAEGVKVIIDQNEYSEEQTERLMDAIRAVAIGVKKDEERMYRPIKLKEIYISGSENENKPSSPTATPEEGLLTEVNSELFKEVEK